MSRLRHDLKAYLRALRMTRTRLIVFIEGKENDPIFYSQIAQRFLKEAGQKVEVRRAQELPGAADPQLGGAGGKPWLTKAGKFWIRYVTKKNRQISCRLLFALDKDIDDVRQHQNADPHFVYTEGYSVENYILEGCDVRIASEAALSLLPGELLVICGADQERWMRESAVLWKEWIGYCVVAAFYKHGQRTRGYGRTSMVNVPHHTACDAGGLEKRFEALRMENRITTSEFTFVRDKADAFVAEKFRAGLEKELMKGEWYIDILWSQITSNHVLTANMVQVGKHGVWSALRLNFKLPGYVYDYYQQAFAKALALPA